MGVSKSGVEEGFRMVLSRSNSGVYLRLQYWRFEERLGRGRGRGGEVRSVFSFCKLRLGSKTALVSLDNRSNPNLFSIFRGNFFILLKAIFLF